MLVMCMLVYQNLPKLRTYLKLNFTLSRDGSEVTGMSTKEFNILRYFL